MKHQFIYLTAALACVVLLGVVSRASSGFLSQALLSALIGAALLGLSALTRLLLQRNGRTDGAVTPARGLFSPAVIGTVAALAAFEALVTVRLSTVLESRLGVEVAYYASLVAAGIVLGRVLNSASWVPAAAAALSLLTVLVCRIVAVASTASAGFNFGPERWLLSVQSVAASIALLPADIGAIGGAWFASRPFNPKGALSPWAIALPLVGVMALSTFFLMRERPQGRSTVEVEGPRAVAKAAPTALNPGKNAPSDLEGARATVEAYLAAAAVNDFRKVEELTALQESDTIVGSYKILRDVGCVTDSGAAEDIREAWEFVYRAAELERSRRDARETARERKRVPTHMEAVDRVSRAHPLLVEIAMGSNAGPIVLQPYNFARDGAFRAAACTFLVEAEFQGEDGSRLRKRQNVAAFTLASPVVQNSRWTVVSRSDIAAN